MSQATVQSCVQFKTGTGKKGPWTLYKVTTTDNQEPTGFDFVQPGEIIELTQTQNGQYTNLNYAKVDGAAPQAAAPAAAPAANLPAGSPAAQAQAAPVAVGGDEGKRILAMLTVIATQLGADPQSIADALAK